MMNTRAESIENERVDSVTHSEQKPIDVPVGCTEDLNRLREEWSKRDAVPRLVASPVHAVDHSWPGVGVRTFLDGDHSGGRQSVHRLYFEPGEGLRPHFLENTDGFFYVLEGDLDFTVGQLTERSVVGTVAYVPARTTTALENVGTTRASVIVLYNPAGVDRAFAEAHTLWTSRGDTEPMAYWTVLSRYGFNFEHNVKLDNDSLTNEPTLRMEFEVSSYSDFQELRKTWTGRRPIPKLAHGFANGPREDILNMMPGLHARHEAMIDGDDCAGRAVMFMGEVPQDVAATPHFQPEEDELFFVVDGQMSLTCGTETQIVTAGAFGFAPRGATHAFHNSAEQSCRVITFNSPAGHERGFETMVLTHALPPEEFMKGVMNYGWRMKGDFLQDLDG